MNINTVRYFAYQIPAKLQSPVVYEILGVDKPSNIPLAGLCLRDYSNPTIYYFWDREGNHVITTNISEVKKWTESLSFVNGAKCSYIYPPQYTIG